MLYKLHARARRSHTYNLMKVNLIEDARMSKALQWDV